MERTIYKTDGTSSDKKADLKDDIFHIEPNETLIYEDVRRYLSNARQGTAKTKQRGEVRGGGKKAYRQKGTGMARRGSIRSPLLRGGGTVFGPTPRTYTVKMTKKMRQKARKSALSLKASDDAITIVEDFTFENPKTKQVIELLDALNLSNKKVLILAGDTDLNLVKSARNLPNVDVMESFRANTYSILNADILLIQEKGLSRLEESFQPKTQEEVA